MKVRKLFKVLLWFNLISYIIYFLMMGFDSWLMECMFLRIHRNIIWEYFLINSAISLFLTWGFLFNLKGMVTIEPQDQKLKFPA